MFEAVPYSVVSMLLYCEICEPEWVSFVKAGVKSHIMSRPG
jgi:hypothetical protein